MTKLAAVTVLSILCLGVVTRSTQACSFDQVLLQDCPASEVQTELLEELSPNRALFAAKYAWTKHPDFRRKEVLQLMVCIFRKPARSVFQNVNQLPKEDFTNRPQALAGAARKLAQAASQWSAPREKIGNRTIQSSVRFNFFDPDGNVRTCEANPDSHVLIVMNKGRINTNSADVGFRYLHLAQADPQAPLATMTLSSQASTKAIVHEFGHALGFIHEMGHIDWHECAKAFDVEAFAERRNISVKTARSAVLSVAERFEDAALTPTERFDRRSVMAYNIEPALFDPGKLTSITPDECSMRQSETLQRDDKSLLLTFYRMPVN